jgi:hypothetical protein
MTPDPLEQEIDTQQGIAFQILPETIFRFRLILLQESEAEPLQEMDDQPCDPFRRGKVELSRLPPITQNRQQHPFFGRRQIGKEVTEEWPPYGGLFDFFT